MAWTSSCATTNPHLRRSHIALNSQLMGCLVSIHALAKAVGQYYSRKGFVVYHTPASMYASNYCHTGLLK